MNPVDVYLVLAVVGALSGLLAGLLGIGGGLVIVPALMLLPLTDHAAASAAHVAVGTSLAAIVPTALASARAHHRRDAVEWPLVVWLGPAMALGALIGAWVTTFLAAPVLQRVFGVFLLAVATSMLRQRGGGGLPRPVPRWMRLAFGHAIGAVSGVVGIGGGTMTVPFLVWRGRDMRRAVGTSAACGVFIALAGAIGFAMLGPRQGAGEILGWVHWPAALIIGLLGMLTAPLGARLAHALPVPQLRRVFVVVLVWVALRLLWPVN